GTRLVGAQDIAALAIADGRKFLDAQRQGWQAVGSRGRRLARNCGRGPRRLLIPGLRLSRLVWLRLGRLHIGDIDRRGRRRERYSVAQEREQSLLIPP